MSTAHAGAAETTGPAGLAVEDIRVNAADEELARQLAAQARAEGIP